MGEDKSTTVSDVKQLPAILREHKLWLESESAQGERANLAEVDLSGANLYGVDLTRSNMREANLEGAELAGACFVSANLRSANLSRANLNGANLAGADLFDANLMDTNLTEVDLSFCSFGRSNLAGCTLSQKFSGIIDITFVSEVTKICSRLFVTILAFSVLLWVVLARTTDVQLVTNSGVVELPIIGVTLSIVGFYIAAPSLLLILHLYLLLHLQRLWEGIVQLPLIFPDGVFVWKKLPPSILTSLGSTRVYSVVQTGLSLVLAFSIAPFTIGSMWLRCLVRNDPIITMVHVVLVFLSIWLSGKFLTMSVKGLPESGGKADEQGTTVDKTLWGKGAFRDSLWSILSRTVGKAASAEQVVRSFAWFLAKKVLYAIPLLALLGAVSAGGLWGSPPNGPDEAGIECLVPTGLFVIGLYPFADLRNATISTRLDGLKPQNGCDPSEVEGADLRGRNLRHANLSKAFLVKANLRNADLGFARLDMADLRAAKLGSLDRRNWIEALIGMETPDQSLTRDMDMVYQLDSTERRNWLKTVSSNEGGLRGNKRTNGLSGSLVSRRLDHRNQAREFRKHAFRRTNLSHATMRFALMSEARLIGADLEGANLYRADLRNSDLQLAWLDSAVFVRAHLDGVHFYGSSLVGTNFEGAVLKGADFRGVDLRSTIGLGPEQLATARIDSLTMLPGHISSEQIEKVRKKLMELERLKQSEQERQKQVEQAILRQLEQAFQRQIEQAIVKQSEN